MIKEASKYKSCKVIKFWSDGCASQFRSKFAFYMLTKFDADLDIQWHFFEANHGKIHYVDRSVIGSICDLKFYKTSTSSEEISSQSYKIGMRLREEQMEEEKNKKLEKERKKKDTEKAKEENLNA